METHNNFLIILVLRMLDNICSEFEHFRLYLNKEEERKLLKEFEFKKRLRKFLDKKIEERFNVAVKGKVASSSLRPFVYGIIKRFKESKKYNFASYAYLDHFEFVSFELFSKYEIKKSKEESKINSYPLNKQREVIRFNRGSFKFSWKEVEFLASSVKGKISPKNKFFHNFRYLYVERIDGAFYIFGQTYKEKSFSKKESLAASIVLNGLSSIYIYDTNNNFTTFNLYLNKESYNLDKLVKLSIYRKEALKKNGGIISNNVIRLEKRFNKTYESIRRKLRAKFAPIAIELVKKYSYISIEKPAKAIYFKDLTKKNVIESFLMNQFYLSLEEYSKRFNTALLIVDLDCDISKICHKCGAFVKDNKSDLIHCDCGNVFDKNLNAAKTLLSYLINKHNLKSEYLFKESKVEQLQLFA